MTSSASRVQALVTFTAFVTAGFVAAVVWWAVVDLPSYTRTAESGAMSAVELSGMVAIDAWFALIGSVAAVTLGALLTVWSARRPKANVALVTLAATLGGLVMLLVGRLLGPGDLDARLAVADEGDLVEVPLQPVTSGFDLAGLDLSAIVLVWPVVALAGVALVLLFGRDPGGAHHDSGSDEPGRLAAAHRTENLQGES